MGKGWWAVRVLAAAWSPLTGQTRFQWSPGRSPGLAERCSRPVATSCFWSCSFLWMIFLEAFRGGPGFPHPHSLGAPTGTLVTVGDPEWS